jgi:uridine kinase
MATVADIFERLAKERRPTTEEAIKQQRKSADLVSRWKQKTEAEAFLMDVLANGPMPTVIIEE